MDFGPWTLDLGLWTLDLLDGFGLRSEMKLFDLQGRRQRSAAALRLGAAHALRRPDHIHVSGREQLQQALVEAEIADRVLDFPILDIPDAVTRQAGGQSGARIDAAN